MADKFAAMRPLLDSPALEGFAVTANDSFNSAFTQPTRALWVGQTGNVRCRFISTLAVMNGAYTSSNTNNIVTLQNVPSGTMLPVRVDMILATGTTANAFVGLF